MARLSDFYPYIVSAAPGIPEPVVDRVLLDTAGQFCRDTLIWLEELEPILLEPGVATYELLPETSQTHVVSVISATIVSGDREAALDREQFAHYLNDEIRLLPAPTAPSELRCKVALQPAATASTLPDFLRDEWRETLGAGAVARLMAVHGDPSRIPMAEALYQAGVARAQAIRQVGRQRKTLRTVAQP